MIKDYWKTCSNSFFDCKAELIEDLEKTYEDNPEDEGEGKGGQEEDH